MSVLNPFHDGLINSLSYPTRPADAVTLSIRVKQRVARATLQPNTAVFHRLDPRLSEGTR